MIQHIDFKIALIIIDHPAVMPSSNLNVLQHSSTQLFSCGLRDRWLNNPVIFAHYQNDWHFLVLNGSGIDFRWLFGSVELQVLFFAPVVFS